MNRKIKGILSLMLLFGIVPVCASDKHSPQAIADYMSDDEDDAGFEDAQDRPLTFNEKIASIQAQYPAIDENTGYDKHLDQQRARIIQDIIDCYRQIFVFSEKSLEYEIKLRRLAKRYEAIQKDRRSARQKRIAKQEKRELKHEKYADTDIIKSRDFDIDSDSDDGCSDCESFSRSRETSSVRSGMRSKSGSSRSKCHSNSSFDW